MCWSVRFTIRELGRLYPIATKYFFYEKLNSNIQSNDCTTVLQLGSLYYFWVM